MTCQDIFAQLSAYLDMDLLPESCEEIREHIAACPPCVEFVRSLERTVELCRGYSPGALPGPLAEQARRDLEQAYQALRRREP